jgi:hypothetical protein
MEVFVDYYNSLDPQKKEEYIVSLTIATDYFDKQYTVSNSTIKEQEQQRACNDVKKITYESK